ncbi:TPA: flippase [Escherichia albertii]|nr:MULTISPECIES: flippase [Escherichia]AHE61802.1 membrane protein [Escherichia albertii KF1]EFA6623885.1 flippase [Escherichia albertii]EFA7084385.1 flippase [Escherichia albertii]EFE6907277.1 flippase [Escherichia albertii]EFF0774797.1 flippase [Escherichia albertii]
MNILKNSFWNIGGFIIPSLIAIPAMGIVARLLGVELFGLFTIFFTIFGFASILDAGLSRAVIREVSMHREDTHRLNVILSTSLVIILVISILGALLITLNATKIAWVFNVSAQHFTDVVRSLRIISISFPFLLFSQIYTGYLEGLENFKSINLQKTVTGSILAISPVAFIACDASLMSGVLGLTLARIISFAINHYYIRRYAKINFFFFDKTICKCLLSYGGWVSVSNIISPLILYCDRFILSNMLGAKNVAFYTAPSEIVNRISIFPNAISRVLFPLFSHSLNKGEATRQLRHGYLLVGSSAFLIILPFLMFPSFILDMWIGTEYGTNSVTILLILLFGMFVNSVAQVTFAEIQAKGYFKATAIIHIIELVPYFCFLYFAIKYYGVIGVAVASTFRVIVDMALLLIFRWFIQNEQK